MNPMQLMAEFQRFRANPMQYMASRGLNIPQQYMTSPEAASKYLMQNRGMSQADINQLMQTASQFQGMMGNGMNNGNGSGNFPG